MLPSLSIEAFLNEFEEDNDVASFIVNEEVKNQTKNNDSKKLTGQYVNWLQIKFKKISIICTMMLVFIVIFGFLFSKNIFKENGNIIRSDTYFPNANVFLNRPKIINSIKNNFVKSKNIQVVALAGIGGVGKTTLARQYCQLQNVDIIWEINAETYNKVIHSFENLSQALAKNESERKLLNEFNLIKNTKDRTEKILFFIKEKLKNNSNWILIYDNVENFSSLKSFFPIDPKVWENGNVLVTTRDSNIGNNGCVDKVVYIDKLNSKEALDLFSLIMEHGNRPLLTKNQKEEAQKFLEKIPPFPLDVACATYYLKSTNIYYSEYINKIHKNDFLFEKLQKEILSEAVEYDTTRNQIVQVSLEKIIGINKEFEELLIFISLLDSQDIPRVLLEQIKDKVTVDSFIYNLKKYSLISNETSLKALGRSFSLHRDTQIAHLSYFTKKEDLLKNKDTIQKIKFSMEEYMNNILIKEDVSKIKEFLQHYEALYNNFNVLNVSETYSIGIKLGCANYYLNHYTRAKEVLEVNLQKAKHFPLFDQKEIAKGMVFLGNIYWELCLFDKSKTILEQSYAIYSDFYNGKEIGIIKCLSMLGNVYRELGMFEKSKDFLEYNLEAYKLFFAVSPQDMALTLTYLGNSYRDLGNIDKAKNIIEQSVGIYNKNFPQTHPKLAWTLAQLGNIYKEQKQFEKARLTLEESIHAYNKNSVVDHIGIAWTQVYLGNVYKNLNHHKKAISLIEKSLVIYKKYFPEDNFRVAWALFNLGDAHKDSGNFEQAIKTLSQSLKSYEGKYDKNNFQIARILRSLSQSYILKNQLDTAESYLLLSLEIFKGSKNSNMYLLFEELGDLNLKKASQSNNRERDIKLNLHNKKALNYYNQSIGILKNCPFENSEKLIKNIQLKIKKIKK